jgi:hypothetical protein
MLHCNVSYDGYVSVHWRYTGAQGESNIGYPFDGPPVKKGRSSIGADSHGKRQTFGCRRVLFRLIRLARSEPA